MTPYYFTSVGLGVALALGILWLVRRDHLHGSYGLWWLVVAFGALAVGFFPAAIDWVGVRLGVSYPPILLTMVTVILILLKLVAVDIDGSRLSLRYPMDVNMVGDSAATLRALLPMLKQKTDTAWTDEIENNLKSWWQTLKDRAMDTAEPLNPQRVFYELSPRLPDNAILTADSGSVANWYARDLKIRRGMKASLSGGLASLGAGTPYAVAGKMAYPDRTVIACMGDGAMQMNGLNVMITISKYWKKWSNPRLIVLVLNNRDLNQVTWEERIQLGAGKTESTQSIPDFPYHRYAELIGLKGIFVDHPDKVGAAWDEALAADRPVIFEAYTDPNVPPLPPHIKLEQAKAYASVLLHGDPDQAGIIKQTAKQVLGSILPGHRKDKR